MKKEKVTVTINRYGMGDAPEELRMILVKNYLTLTAEGEAFPTYICLYADGVRLAVEGSPVTEQLKILEERGVNILICKTCLGFYGLTEKVTVGTVATMVDIIGAQNNCDKSIVL